jgi:endonuclease YncB( thermonuclease family)
LAKRNDIGAPYQQPEARRWTRVTDYWPDADAHVANIHWTKPGSSASRALPDVSRGKGRGSRGLILPIVAVMIAALLSAWASGLFGMRGRAAAVTAATTSRGLIFGLCSEGGLTNCVASGDSFYLGGKTVRIAGIEAPELYGAACPQEAETGRKAVLKLQALLNSGELELTPTGQDLDRYGLLLRNVSVDGKSVGNSMVDARLAREIGDLTRSWC